MWFTYIAVMTVMVINSIQDIRKNEIFPIITIAGSVCGIIVKALTGAGVLQTMLPLCPAMMLFLIFNFLKEAVGFGDVLLFVFVGAWLNAEDVLACAMYAFCIVLIGAAALALCKKKKRHLPFAPFLTAGITLRLIFLM